MSSVGPSSRSTFSRNVALVGVSSFFGSGVGEAGEARATTPSQTNGATRRTADTSERTRGGATASLSVATYPSRRGPDRSTYYRGREGRLALLSAAPAGR